MAEETRLVRVEERLKIKIGRKTNDGGADVARFALRACLCYVSVDRRVREETRLVHHVGRAIASSFGRACMHACVRARAREPACLSASGCHLIRLPRPRSTFSSPSSRDGTTPRREIAALDDDESDGDDDGDAVS